MCKLTGKVAIVTGAGNARGIGFASARKMALNGATIILTDTATKEDSLNELAARLSAEAKVQVLPMICDITDDAAMQACVEKAVGKLGHIDILFNNAGIATLQDFVDTDIAYFDLIYRVNVRGAVVLSKLVLPAMQKQRSGVIINNSSNSGVYGVQGQTHYCMTKHALIGFTKALASEVGKDNIRVLAICPGLIDTDIYRDGLPALGLDPETEMARMVKGVSLGRWASADEVGNFVAFAASDEASYLTGTYYHIHGGFPINGLV